MGQLESPRSNPPLEPEAFPNVNGSMAGPASPLGESKLRAEVKLAKRELEKWQFAYDNCCEPDHEKFIAEIRRAEARLAAARKALGEVARPISPAPAVKHRMPRH